MATQIVLAHDPGKRLASACTAARTQLGESDWHFVDNAAALIAALNRSDQSVDLILLGPDTHEPIGLAQRIAAVDREIGIILFCEPQNFASIRSVERFSPFLGRGLEIFDLDAAESLPELVRHSVRRTRQRRKHQMIVHVAQSQQLALEPKRPNLNQTYNQLVEAAPIGIVLLSPQNDVISINRCALGLVNGREQDLVGRPLAQAFPESARAQVSAFLRASAATDQVAHQFISWAGARMEERVLDLRLSRVEDQAARGGRMLTLQDFSEQRRLESQLRHAQKLEAIGTLAGGVAHDFNNLLTPILNYAKLIAQRVSDEKTLSMLSRIGSAADRARQLVEQLLSYAGQAPRSLEAARLEDLVTDVKKLIEPLSNEKLFIRAQLSETPPLQLDVNQIHQVLMNLCMNAIHAMQDGGTLALQVLPPARRQFENVQAQRVDGVFVSVSVSDDGPGIPHDIRQKVFEPFFSTRKGGEGTGLGLAVVMGIVNDHDGHLELQCPEGGGTRILVHFPIPE